MIDNDDIDLLGGGQGHLHLPAHIVKILQGDSHCLNLKLTPHTFGQKMYHVADLEDDRFQESDENGRKIMTDLTSLQLKKQNLRNFLNSTS